jgi:deoxyribonuclease V
LNEVLGLLRHVPKGRVTTYAALAKAVGSSPRGVASLLSANASPDAFPCYKVVMSDGRLGGYSAPGGVAEKARRLRADGVDVVDGRVDLKRFGFRFSRTTA